MLPFQGALLRGVGKALTRHALLSIVVLILLHRGEVIFFFPPLGLELLYICKCDDGSQLFIARVPATLITTTADF